MNFKNIHAKILLSCWTSLGFYRGTKQYNYYYNKYKTDRKSPYMYTKEIEKETTRIVMCGMYGIFGILIYINPFCAPVIISKEIYRTEVYIRNLHDERNKDYYNNVL
jgi:hypothetical protein